MGFRVARNSRQALATLVGKYGAALAVVAAIVVYAASVYIHDPSTPTLLGNWGFKYSDVVYGLFYPIFEKPERWFSASRYYELALKGFDKECPVPYVDYKFEYPPLVGLLWYASTCTGFKLARIFAPSAGFKEYLNLAARIHYYVNAAVAAACFALLLVYLRKLGTSWSRLVVYALLPSILMYSTYNWDLVAVFFAVAGLYEYFKKRYLASGVLMGLSVSAKLLTAGLALWLFIELYLAEGKSRRNLAYYSAGLLVILLVFFGGLALYSWRGLLAFYEHHANWYCENCIYMLFVKDIWSESHRVSFIGFLALTWLFMLEARTKSSRAELAGYVIPATYSTVVLNYVFSPQMILLLAPPSLVYLSSTLLKIYVAADILNALIMVLFFKDSEVRALLGLEPKFSPHTIDSPVQWIAMARNTLLLLIMLGLLLDLVLKEDQGSSQ